MAEVFVSRQILEYLSKDNGSDFSATKAPGGYLVTVNNPDVERQLNAALRIMDEYEETLRILAK